MTHRPRTLRLLLQEKRGSVLHPTGSSTCGEFSLPTVRRIDLTILFCVCFYPKGHVDGFPGINTVYMRNPKESKK